MKKPLRIVLLILLLVVVAAIGFAIGWFTAPRNDSPSPTDTAIGRPTPWAERPVYRKYNRLETADESLFFASESEYTVPEEMVHVFLYDTEIIGRDDTDPLNAIERRIAAKVYSVKSFNSEVVLAVKYEGQDAFYLFKKTPYKPSTFAVLLEDLNLRSFATLTDVRKDENGSTTRYEVDAEACWALLAECVDAPLVNAQIPGNVGIFFTMPIVFEASHSSPVFAISEKGYLSTNAQGTLLTFEIGTAQAEKMINALTAK